MKIKPLMLLPLAVTGLLLIGGLVANQRRDADQLPTAFAGKKAPSVAVTPLGELPTFSDETLRDGEVKLVNFWASWCAPCRVEHPNLVQLSEGEGLAIYGVNYKDKPAAALGFLEELGDPYLATGADESGRMGLDWGLYGVPETFVIDGDGNVVERFAGPITERALENTIRPAIARALGDE